MNTIGPYGKGHTHDAANRDDILDQGDARGFRDKHDDGNLAGFDNHAPQDENADPRAGGRSQQRNANDPGYQAALAVRTSDFQRSMNAAQHHETETDEPEMDEEWEPLDTFSAATNAGRSGQQTTGQQGLSQLFAHNDKASAQAEVETSDEKLLAMNAALSSTIPMLTALQQTGPVQASESVSRAQDIATAVENRVSQAIQAELAATSGSINTISLNVAGLIEGLTAITIRLSATGLDVVLSGAAEELAGEAQALADRLSKRFSNRNVRILSAPDSGGGSNDNEDALTSSQSPLHAPIKGPDFIS